MQYKPAQNTLTITVMLLSTIPDQDRTKTFPAKIITTRVKSCKGIIPVAEKLIEIFHGAQEQSKQAVWPVMPSQYASALYKW